MDERGTPPNEMSVADATRVLLLVVRLRAVAEVAALSEMIGAMSVALPESEVEVLIGRLELAGLVEHRDGSHPGWRITPDGRAEGQRLLAVELDEAAIREEVTGAYESFVPLNSPLLRACTDWQLRDANPAAPVVNDHTDAAFDAEVIERLGAVHDDVLPVVDELTIHLPRFGMYRKRFTHAMERIRAGDVAAFDQPDTDSYHAIWFELHEHLLATVGRDRSTEPLPEPAYRPPSD